MRNEKPQTKSLNRKAKRIWQAKGDGRKRKSNEAVRPINISDDSRRTFVCIVLRVRKKPRGARKQRGNERESKLNSSFLIPHSSLLNAMRSATHLENCTGKTFREPCEEKAGFQSKPEPNTEQISKRLSFHLNSLRNGMAARQDQARKSAGWMPGH